MNQALQDYSLVLRYSMRDLLSDLNNYD